MTDDVELGRILKGQLSNPAQTTFLEMGGVPSSGQCSDDVELA
jgi:hypothetical protein